MASSFFCISTLSLFAVIVNGNIITPCKVTDKACILASAKKALPKIISGIPELGIPSSDPLNVDSAKGDLSILKFTFSDIVIGGYKKCDVKQIDLKMEANTLKLVLVCPHTTNTGNYQISGRLIILPIEGSGTYSITVDKYQLTINAEIQKIVGKDGKEHLNIKNFKAKAEALEPIVYRFNNLFNGQKDLADAVHKFANENYKEVSDFVSDPIFAAVVKAFFKNVNKYLKIVPLEEIFLP